MGASLLLYYQYCQSLLVLDWSRPLWKTEHPDSHNCNISHKSLPTIMYEIFQVVLCTGGVASSFFLHKTHQIPFEATLNHTVKDTIFGHFHGLTAPNGTIVNEFWNANLYPHYTQDCADASSKVDFFTVFGVLFSGVTGIMAGMNDFQLI